MSAQRLVVALAVALAVVVVVVGLTRAIVEQRERAAYCAGMGETWQDRVELPDGSTMPGQCVDLGVLA